MALLHVFRTLNMKKLLSVFLFVPLLGISASAQTLHERVITHSELRDKIMGEWLGQMIGLYFGLPFELLYFKDPVPIDYGSEYSLDMSKYSSGMYIVNVTQGNEKISKRIIKI